MLLENINSNLEDMIQMTSGLQARAQKQAQTEAQNRTLRAQVRQLSERNEQLSLSILKDQKKLSTLGSELESAKKDITEYLKMIEDLRSMKRSLEEKSDEMVEVIRRLRSGAEARRESADQSFEDRRESGGERYYLSAKEGEKKPSPADYDTNIRESKVLPSGNPMAQTKKFPGVVSGKNAFPPRRSRQASKKGKRGEAWRLARGGRNPGEIRELLTDSSRAEDKTEDRPGKRKNRTQPEVLPKGSRGMENVYNSHKPDSRLENRSKDKAASRIRSRSKPMKQSTSGADLRNRYQAMRLKQKVKLYKQLKGEATSKDIEKRLKMASKSPKRDTDYLGLERRREPKKEVGLRSSSRRARNWRTRRRVRGAAASRSWRR